MLLFRTAVLHPVCIIRQIGHATARSQRRCRRNKAWQCVRSHQPPQRLLCRSAQTSDFDAQLGGGELTCRKQGAGAGARDNCPRHARSGSDGSWKSLIEGHRFEKLREKKNVGTSTTRNGGGRIEQGSSSNQATSPTAGSSEPQSSRSAVELPSPANMQVNPSSDGCRRVRHRANDMRVASDFRL